jgi:hypothetical protein
VLSHVSLATLLWTAAAGVLGYAVQLRNGHLIDEAVAPLEWTIALTLAALLLSRVGTAPVSDNFQTVVASGVLVFQLGELFITPPGIYLTDGSDEALAPFRWGVVLSGCICFALASRPALPGKLAAVGVSLLLAVHFAMGVWMIRSSPQPFIDTYVFQRDSVAALFAGDNPYAITFPNIYGDETNYGPGMSRDGRLRFGFVYPPLSLLFAAAGDLLGGDVRYAQLTATTLAAACLLALSAGRRVALLAVAIFLFTPRGFFVLEQSWTEPYLVLLFACVLWSAARAPRALPYAIGLLLSIKQHMLLIVPLLWLLPNPPRLGPELRAFATRVAATVAVIALPFVIWGPRAFARSAIAMQFRQPQRSDALSFAALWATEHASPLPQWVPFICAAVGIAIALWRAPRTRAGFAGATALVYLLFFVCAKQAFCNYYYFVIGLLCCAIASDRDVSSEPSAG